MLAALPDQVLPLALAVGFMRMANVPALLAVMRGTFAQRCVPFAAVVSTLYWRRVCGSITPFCEMGSSSGRVVARAVRGCGVIVCAALPGRLPFDAVRTRIGISVVGKLVICEDMSSGVALSLPFTMVRGDGFQVMPLSVEIS